MQIAPERRLIGYARVSTDDQDLTLQRRALIAHGVAEEHIFEEHASGAKMDRPALKRALRAARGGDTLMVWKLDRLGRTLTGVIETVELMKADGVELVSLTEKLDTASAMGEAFFRISLIFAELERKLISERTKAGIAVRKAQGVKFGQPGKIVDNPKRLAVARQIVEEGVENITAREALRRLNEADKKAKPIKSIETWNRWRRLGCPGADD